MHGHHMGGEQGEKIVMGLDEISVLLGELRQDMLAGQRQRALLFEKLEGLTRMMDRHTSTFEAHAQQELRHLAELEALKDKMALIDRDVDRAKTTARLFGFLAPASLLSAYETVKWIFK